MSGVESIGMQNNWYQACPDRKGWFKLCQGDGKVKPKCRKNTRVAMYCPIGKVTSAIVEDPFNNKATLQGINNFAVAHQPEMSTANDHNPRAPNRTMNLQV